MNLLDFPDDIIKLILSSWLAVNDWMTLQRAWDNKSSLGDLLLLMQSTYCNGIGHWAVNEIEWAMKHKLTIGNLSLNETEALKIKGSFQPNKLQSLTLDPMKVVFYASPIRKLFLSLIHLNPNLSILYITDFSNSWDKPILSLSNLKVLPIKSTLPFNDARLVYLNQIAENNKQLTTLIWKSARSTFSVKSNKLSLISNRGLPAQLQNLVNRFASRIVKADIYIIPLTVSVLRDIMLCLPKVKPIFRLKKKLKPDFLVGNEDINDKFCWRAYDFDCYGLPYKELK